MKLTEINQTEKAKKKIANIAKKNNLDYEFVYSIITPYWNYDGPEGHWVKNLTEDNENTKRLEKIYGMLNLNKSNESLDKDRVAEILYNRLKKLDKNILENNFLAGAKNGSYCYVSEYASYHYLTNATSDKLKTLDWTKGTLNNETIVENIFLKIFRGGSIERYNLGYLYSDLIVKLPYAAAQNNAEDWTKEFIRNARKNKTTLTDLLKMLDCCKGDKYFKRTVLEALSYSGKLKVDGHEVENKFIPDYRNELSKHFYSNEWTYPLRFWN
ncbi:MAG: hypothetical protein LBT33_05570 [Spirochaetia bacterium]|jgi:hypothetical protein|nr:hypothetical protein [Spirochaetia bacterium]